MKFDTTKASEGFSNNCKQSKKKKVGTNVKNVTSVTNTTIPNVKHGGGSILSHMAKATMEWLTRDKSPDLNPTENLWSFMKAAIH